MTSEPRLSPSQPDLLPQSVESNQRQLQTGRPDTMLRATPPAPIDAMASRSNGPHTWQVIWRWLRDNTFVPPWLPARWRHPATGYLLVVALQVTAVVITRLLLGFFSTYAFPGALELLVVMLVALSWGAGPGLFATLLGVVLEEIVVLPEFGEVGDNAADLVEVALFLAVGISISLVASASERSRRRAVKERAEAQERELASMRQAQGRMDAFLAVASHDLRSPVMAALGFIEIAAHRCERLAGVARAGRGEESDLVRQIDGIGGCVRDALHSEERLAQLVNLLFDISLARAGELKLQPALCDLAAMVRELVEGQRVSAPDRTIRLQIHAPEPVWVMADAARIGQVVTNYLTNALKYSPSEAAVDVRLTLRDCWVRVAVADRGPGLPPGELERVWQRFYRVAEVSTQSGSGSGLGVGLHISKTIVDLHGGEIGVESVVGRGSTFWFALPLDEQPAA